MSCCQVTYIGSATFLIEVGGARLLTDPALDPAGTEYVLEPVPGAVIGARKLLAPAAGREALGALDAVLLSHDEHFDNLDGEGRILLGEAATTITTPAAAVRLGAPARGLMAWESTIVPGRPDVRVTAVPARHGPEGTEAIIGDTTGFVVQWGDGPDKTLYVSGDTVWFDGLEEIARRFDVGTAVIHLGSGGFEAAGDLRFSLDATEGARLAEALGAHRVIPSHFEGWTHFSETPEHARLVLTESLGDRVLWLTAGVPYAL